MLGSTKHRKSISAEPLPDPITEGRVQSCIVSSALPDTDSGARNSSPFITTLAAPYKVNCRNVFNNLDSKNKVIGKVVSF